jgi:hypothetical protein
MAMGRFLKDSKFNPQEQQLLELAYRRALKKLSLVDRDDPVCEIVAEGIMNAHRNGASDVIAISEMAIKDIDAPES